MNCLVHPKSFLIRMRRALIPALVVVTSLPSLAALPVVPVFLKETFPPNVTFTIDDSGSMSWAHVPDGIGIVWGKNRYYASSYNPLYYDPAKTYAIPTKPDGSLYVTSFSAAKMDPFMESGPTVSLTKNLSSSTGYVPTFSHIGNDSGANENSGGIYTGYNGGNAAPAAAAPYYYIYNTATGGCSPKTAATIELDACYTKTAITVAEQQNFANWYSFYRTRNLMVKSSLLLAMKSFPDATRIAWQGLNTCNSGFGIACTAGGTTFTNRMGEFSSTHKTDFLTWVTKGPAAGGTPLQDAFVRAGKYYQTTGTENPYSTTPGTSGGTLSACRLSYHVALTDGTWNSGAATETTSTGPILDADNRGWTLGDSGKTFSYAPRAPFAKTDAAVSGSWVNLSDIAFYYWATDLQPSVANNTPVYSSTGNKQASHLWTDVERWDPRNDPAYWQHMVNYTIGLGLERALTSPQWQGSTFASDGSGIGYAQFATGTVAWPVTGADVTPGNVYDLWHAAINSRGEFFSVANPNDLSVAFKRILGRISGRTGSVGSAGASSSGIYSDTGFFQATYDSSAWSGTIKRYNIDKYGQLSATASWSTDTTLATLTTPNRWVRQTKSATFPNPGVLNLTNYGSFDATTKATLVSTQIAGWLNGSKSNERSTSCPTCTLRGRSTTLFGDVLGSAPVLSAKEDFGYANASWASTAVADAYVNYLRAKALRTPVLVVGANDGFVHVLSATSGTGGSELFAYAPGPVTPKLANLTDLNYVKDAYVDGPIVVGDAYINSAWRTYAVGTLGVGGKGIYALDISNPSSLDGTSVKWEYPSASTPDPDLGSVISKPLIVRLPNGTWAALFSSGYESSHATPILYAVNLETGALIAKSDTNANQTACNVTITAATYPYNGLGALRHYTTKTGIAITYAGDLAGNMWRFVWGATSTPSVGILAKACRNNVPQPITAAPAVTSIGIQPFVHFGTGKLFASGDTSLATLNTMYAVIDDVISDSSVAARTRSDLGAQTVTTSGVTPNRLRVLSNNVVNLVDNRGWYLDLDLSGERIISQTALFDQRSMFSTFLPDPTSCDTAGTSFAFSVDASTGGALLASSFDVDGNGVIGNTGDLVSGKVVSGIEIGATLSSFSVSSVSSNPAINKAIAGNAARTGACRANELKWTVPKAYDTNLVSGCVPGPLARSGWRQIR